MATLGGEGVRYLRVKRKTDDDPCFSSREYKRCKYIASVKSNLIQDILKVVNNQNVSESNIIDINQDRTGEENDEDGAITCNGTPLVPADNTNTNWVYDIYSLQEIDTNLYSLNEEDEEEDSNDSDSNCENNPRNEYPDEDDYHYKDVDYYGDWEDDEEYKLREQFGDFGVKESDDIGSSSDDSIDHYDEAEETGEMSIDPHKVDILLAKKG